MGELEKVPNGATEAGGALVPVGEAGVVPGFASKEGFELLQRMAVALSKSDLVPKEYRNNIPNAVIALELAGRIGASPLAVMQNLYIVHGKPGWGSSFIIAALNNTGKFTPLRFAITGPEEPREVTTEITEYVGGQKTKKAIKETIRNKTCVAWAIEKATKERLESPPVSIEMAVKEGWYSKDGSKWKTMEDLMLRYRCATLFGRLYCPEILMGMQTAEEVIDITPEGEQPPAANRPAPGKGIAGLKATLVAQDPAVTEPPATPPPQEEKTQGEATAPQGEPFPDTGADDDAGGPEGAPTQARTGDGTLFGGAATSREPGSDEQEDREDPVPKETSSVPQFLARHKGKNDLLARWKQCEPVLDKAKPAIRGALQKNFESLLGQAK